MCPDILESSDLLLVLSSAGFDFISMQSMPFEHDSNSLYKLLLDEDVSSSAALEKFSQWSMDGFLRGIEHKPASSCSDRLLEKRFTLVSGRFRASMRNSSPSTLREAEVIFDSYCEGNLRSAWQRCRSEVFLEVTGFSRVSASAIGRESSCC